MRRLLTARAAFAIVFLYTALRWLYFHAKIQRWKMEIQ